MSKYITLKKHILQKYRTKTYCNNLILPAFNMDGKWFGIVHNFQEIKATNG